MTKHAGRKQQCPKHVEFSPQARNRIQIWECALQQALNYLKVAEHLENSPIQHGMIKYELPGVPMAQFQAHVEFIAGMGLTDAAVVLARQVFTGGAAGPGFAANRGAPEVDTFREEMQREVTEQAHLEHRKIQRDAKADT